MSHRTWNIVRLDTRRRVAVAKHVKGAAWLKRAVQALATKLGTRLAAFPAEAKRRNPEPLVRGQVWLRRFGDGSDKVESIRGNRVVVVGSDGKRTWMDTDEFIATHFTPRKRNPDIQVSGTLSVSRARSKRHRAAPRKRAARTPRAPRAAAARRDLEPGESVTVPYTGRSSYFGRPVKRTTEPGKVVGYTESSTSGGRLVQVAVKRGKGTEQHEFPEASVRRRAKRDYRTHSEKHPEIRKRLEASVAGDEGKALHLLELANTERDAAEQYAMTMGPGDPEYARARRAMHAAEARRAALDSIARDIQRSRPGYVDPFILPNGRRRNPGGIGRAGQDATGGPLFRLRGGAVVRAHNLRPTEPMHWIIRAQAEKFRRGLNNSGDFEVWKPASSRMVYLRYVGSASRANPGGAVHRAGLTGKAVCGAAGRVKVSTSGVGVTCPACLEASRPASRAEVLAEISRQAKARRGNPKRARRKNPRGAERSRAERMFQRWHEFPSNRTNKVKVPSRTIPRHVVGLGKVVRIDYISNKWEGKPVTYTHSTKRPYPELVSDPDGRQLYLVGGRMKPTADGLVN